MKSDVIHLVELGIGMCPMKRTLIHVARTNNKWFEIHRNAV
jgi:hypothetical protein